jgi:hypothetical protein
VHTLNELVGDGHVYAPQDELLKRAAELLGAPGPLIAAAIQRLAEQDLVIVESLEHDQVAVYPRACTELRWILPPGCAPSARRKIAV